MQSLNICNEPLPINYVLINTITKLKTIFGRYVELWSPTPFLLNNRNETLCNH